MQKHAAPINDRNIVANCDDVVVIRDVVVVVVVVNVDISETNSNRSRRRGGIGRGSRSARRWSARPLKHQRQKETLRAPQPQDGADGETTHKRHHGAPEENEQPAFERCNARKSSGRDDAKTAER